MFDKLMMKIPDSIITSGIIICVMVIIGTTAMYCSNSNEPTFVIHNNSKTELCAGDVMIIEAVDKNGTIHIVPRNQSNNYSEPELIWNDDIESIPAEGEYVKIDMIDEDRVYFGPIN
jgi:hypothetical protein